jgi:hypothetical protein
MRYARELILVAVVLIVLVGQGTIVAAAGLQGLDIEKLSEWKMNNVSQGGTLLFSDSPEMVTSDGILYQDKVEGKVRLFFYHVNASVVAKKVDVILENKGQEVAHVTVSQYGLAGPGYDWMAVGKQGMTSYLAGSQSYQINVPPGGTVPLSIHISETAVLPNMLIKGVFDFSVDRQITVKVMMLPVLEDSDKFAKTAKILPPDQHHLRGTFAGANRQLSPVRTYDPAHDGTVALTLADNVVDHYLEGIDATDGTKVVNYGNYGVVYQILFPSKNSGKFACYFVPMGGAYAGAIGINHPDVTWSPLATPMGKLYFGSNKSEDFNFLGTYDGGDSLSFTFSPPGASNLPVEIVIVPQ